MNHQETYMNKVSKMIDHKLVRTEQIITNSIPQNLTEYC